MSAGGHEYPRVQILTIAELLAGQAAPRMPPQDKRSAFGYRAARQAGAVRDTTANLFRGA